MEDFNKTNMFNQKLYNVRYHTTDLSSFNFLITGGAGFIGSNICEYLLRYNAGRVKVLDNLSNGYFSNIEKFGTLSNFEFIEGDIRDYSTCIDVLQNVDIVFHHAALGSVPRSIADPITSNEVNVSGFLNMLVAAQKTKRIKRFIYAASSSTYGDSQLLPKIEGNEGKPLSPYAVTKAVNEMYAETFSKVYGFHTIGLRYFNVFGPKQNPNNPYAAVVPIFCKHFIDGTMPTINGDGFTTRDFTFIENVVQANLKAAFYNKLEGHEVFNVACGDQISLNQMIALLKGISGKDIEPLYKEERIGDVKHSKASIRKIKEKLDYLPLYSMEQGLKIVFDWYQENIKS